MVKEPKFYSVIMVCLFLIFSVLFTLQTYADDDPHATGLIRPTAEQLQKIHSKMVYVDNIQLNALGGVMNLAPSPHALS